MPSPDTNSPASIRIVPLLTGGARHVPVVASWIFGEWGHFHPNDSAAKTERDLRAPAGADGLPLTLVALDGDDTPLGTVSLLRQDIEADNPLTPWLASLYVVSAYRRRGLGTRLFTAAEATARRLGIEVLYLFTQDREALYANLGWRAIERRPFCGQDVVVMTRKLG